jgi:large repetitive protein
MKPSVWLRLCTTLALASVSACSVVFGDFTVTHEPADGGAGGTTADGSSPDGSTPGGLIVVSPTNGLITTESGGQATFTVVLQAKPSSNVVIALTSSDETEGTVSPESLIFTAANWNAPQTVTVTGVDDPPKDGNQTYTILTSAASSADPRYAGLDADDVTVVNVDNESAGFTIKPTTGLMTTEAGGQATFTVVLNSAPTADVTLPLSSSNTNEGTIRPASLTFTKANWNAPQTVTVTGVDDGAPDGPQSYTIVTAAANSGDASYAGNDPEDVQVTNIDNDTPGVTVSPVSGLTTNEGGETATFTLVLNLKPTANVTIALQSSNTDEGVVTPSSVTFTPLNWNAPQTITVTGVNDNVADGNQPYTIATQPAEGAGSGYEGYDAADVLVTNVDNDSPGITVKPTSGLSTNENGQAATFTIVLNSKPRNTGDTVKVDLASSAPGEGTVSPASVTFTATNWSAPQTITVTGVDDHVADGDQPYKVVVSGVTSSDPGYNGLAGPEVQVTNIDNDSPGITVTVPSGGLTTTEAGGMASFTIVLNSQPQANVTLPISSSNTMEGTVSPKTVTFTPTNWSAPQTVTVTGVEDTGVIDGNQVYQVIIGAATSTDTNYNGRDPNDIQVTNTDNDSPGITVTPTSGLVTTEAQGTATFTVVLNAQPKADVTIGISSTDTTEGTVSTDKLTFTMLNWNAPQTVTVTGVDDQEADGSQPYRVHTSPATSTDPAYNGLDAREANVTNTDNDSAGITVTGTANLQTTESTGTASFKVVLNSKPTANVTIAVSSSRTGEGTVSPTSLTFTPDNWSAPQTVTATGVDDLIADGNQVYTIVLAAAVSTDPNYSGRNAPDVSITNVDNDSAGITVTAAPNLTTTEAGGTATFTIVLNSKPVADVTVGISSSRTSEGTVSPASVTFTPSNWNAPQTVTIKGANDNVADGSQPYTIVTAAAVSTDTGYAGMNPPDVAVTNTDNDSAGITVTVAPNLQTTEGGGTATFTIVLNSQPTAPVAIALSSNDTGEGTVSPTSVSFTPSNWNAPKVVTVKGVDDDVSDGNQIFTIVTAPATSNDNGYKGINAADVTITNVDNDSPGITVNAAPNLKTTEAAGNPAQFTVVLNTKPASNVVIPLASSDSTEGKPAPVSLTFTPLNWNAPQSVTVTGQDDLVADGNQVYKILLQPAMSSDAYNGLDGADVTLTNVDNDSAGITVTAAPNLQTGENPQSASASFTVVLNSQPTSSVTIAVSTSPAGEGTVVAPATGSLVFTNANWDSPQTVTVKGVNDDIADGNQVYSVVLAAATSADGKYAGIDPPDVSVTNIDNDSPGIVVTPILLETTEASGGPTGSFSVVLTSEPTFGVNLPVGSDDTGEGKTNVTALVFTKDDWNVAHTVTIAGQDDDIADGNQQYHIVIGPSSSTDPNYQGLDPADLLVTNKDNDSAAILVNPTSCTTSESGTTATFNIGLNSQPTDNVTITLTSSDTNEATVPASVTFTPTDWGLRPITVTPVNDALPDGDQPYTITTGIDNTTTDSNYHGMKGSDVSCTNVDND